MTSLCADDKIKYNIAELNTQNNYWGWLFSSIKREKSNISSIMGVSATKDGKILLLYNEKLVLNTDSDNLYQVIKHEGLHIIKNHLSRLIRLIYNRHSKNEKNKINKVFGIAADIVCNQDGNIHREIMIDGHIWKSCFADLYNLPKNLTTEDYYLRLFDDVDVVDDDVDISFDDHTSWKDLADKESDLNSLAIKIDHETKKLVSDSLKKFSKIRGSHIPSEIKEMIDKLLSPPKIPYYHIISKLVKGSRKAKRIPSSNRANRKRLALSMNSIILPYPGKTNDFSFNIVIILDTSMSMSKEDIMEGLSSCKNIMEKDRDCKVTIIEIDTAIRKEYVIEKIKDIEMSISGRGGTHLHDGLVRARQLKSDCTLVFTDGYTENINEMNKCDLPKKIIWIIQKDENKGTIKNINRFPHIIRV